MLNILWVEDNFSQEKQDIWFNGRVPDVKTDFVTALKAIHNNLNQYDLVILDIDLENTPHNEQVIAFANYFGKTEKEFLQESGMFLFLQLIERGFSRERIIFLTGNADENISRVDELRKASEQDDDALFNEIFAEIQKGLNENKRKELHPFIENDDIENLCSELEKYYNSLHHLEEKNTYNRFCDSFKKAFIEPPKEINKGLNVTKRLNEWLENHEKNDYLVLRRGIVEACNSLKNLFDAENKLLFNSFIEDDDKTMKLEDAHNYLDVLANFLPLHKPVDKSTLYKLFIRTLTHEWEATEPKKIRGLAWIMKSTRNWITHNSTLFNALDETMVAYLFMINMRLMFSFDEAVQPHEKILLTLFKDDDLLKLDTFKNQAASKSFPLSKAYLELKNIVLDERQDKRNNVQDGFYFNELANNLQQSNSSFKKDKALFFKLLYQMFWLSTSNPFISTGNRRNLLEIKFWDFNYSEKPYIFELARHIYSRSFL